MTLEGAVEAPFDCWKCTKKLAEAAGPGTRIRCRHCHAVNATIPLEQLLDERRSRVYQAIQDAASPAPEPQAG